MIERASPRETATVNTLAAALWYAKTAIFIAFAGGRTSKGGLD